MADTRRDPTGKRVRVVPCGQLTDELINRFVYEGRVEHVACAEGDCWHIVEDDGTVHYVQQFQEIIEVE